MKTEQGTEQPRWPFWHKDPCCASENGPVSVTPVLGLVLLWPFEKRSPSLGIPTSFRTSRSPSCEAGTSDATRATRSHYEQICRGMLLQSTMLHGCFQSPSRLNRHLLSSLSNLPLCLPQHSGARIPGLCSAAAAQSWSALCGSAVATGRDGLSHWAGSAPWMWQALVPCP